MSSVDIGLLEKWVSDILAARAVKAWVPVLFADPETVINFPLIGGMKVAVDPTLPVHMLVIRCAEAFHDKAYSIKCAAGDDMAHLQWGISK